MADPYYKKISLLIPNDTYERLNALFERGERNRVMVNVIDWMCDKIETHGRAALIVFLREKDFGEIVELGREDARGNY